MSTKSFPLDLLAQQPRINKLYTHLTLCFRLNNEQRTTTTEILTNACNALSDSVPWSAGEVIYNDTSFNIQYGTRTIQLVLKEMEEPTFNDLKTAQFPFSMIHETDYAPCNTVATADATKGVLPVFMVQATYVKGGLLLTLAGQHGAMDVVGLGQLIYLFSKLCRGKTLDKEETDVANAKRWNNLSAMSKYMTLHDQSHGQEVENKSKISPTLISVDTEQLLAGPAAEPQSSATDTRPNQPDEERAAHKNEDPLPSSSDKLLWAYFAFLKSSLNVLKKQASESLETGTFVSTDDVLTAFIWLALTRVRAQTSLSLRSSSSTTTLSRQVDMRRYLSLPPTYPGLMVQETQHTQPVNTLLHQYQSLGSIALQLRSALDSSSPTRHFYEKIQGLSAGHSDSKSKKAREIPPLEVRLSSWSKLSCYNLDLGFGRPVCVRRPAFSEGARDGLVYFLPKELDGNITVAICLKDGDLRALKEDAEFAGVADYIG